MTTDKSRFGGRNASVSTQCQSLNCKNWKKDLSQKAIGCAAPPAHCRAVYWECGQGAVSTER